jgi:hypothetical protein
MADMAEVPDFELRRTPDEMAMAEPPLRTGRVIAILVVLAIVAAISAGLSLYLYLHRPAPAAAPATKATSPPSQVRPLGGQAESITVPPLDESDAVVRDLVRRITSHPEALAWLATRGLIRTFAVVVDNVVDGRTPARHLTVLRPASPFKVVERNHRLFNDPRSYDRYDRIADAAASIDPAGAARVYATLKPRIGEAYGQLGLPPDSFDRAVERAIVALLQTPVVDGPVRVEPKGGTAYQYADPNLEELTAAQKHLLRTGPRNVRTVQSALRQLALALGIPPERLPGK